MPLSICDRNIFKRLTTESSRKESGNPWLHNIILQILGSNLSTKKRPWSCSCRLRGIFCEVLISQDRIGCLQPTVLPETSGNSDALGAVKVCDIFSKKLVPVKFVTLANEVKWRFFGSWAWFSKIWGRNDVDIFCPSSAMWGEGQLLIKRDCDHYDLSAPPLRMPRHGRQVKELPGVHRWTTSGWCLGFSLFP